MFKLAGFGGRSDNAAVRKRRGILILLLAGIVLAAAVVFYLLPPSEPVYQGKTLSQCFDNSRLDSLDTDAERHAALREMGTNVLPFVRSMILRQDSPLKLKIMALVSKQHLINFHFRTDEYFHGKASLVCSYLDSSMKGKLVADWVRFVERGNRRDLAFACQAVKGPGGVGPDALEASMKAITNSNPRVRLFGAITLRIRSEAKAIVPVLLGALKDQDAEVRGEAALSLGWFGQEPEKVIPALLQGMDDLDRSVRMSTIWALTRFTNQSSIARSAIVKALNDKDTIVRTTAAEILGKPNTPVFGRARAEEKKGGAGINTTK